MNLKFNLSMVNTILMIVVLILVVVACVRRYRENFSVCHIPCNADGSGNGIWDEGTKGFKCGGPECADVNSYGAGEGTDTGFVGLDSMDSVSKGWADNTVKGPMDQVKLAAAVLYKQFKINLVKYDADADSNASSEYKNLINSNYLKMLKTIGFKDAKLEDSESKHTTYLEAWIKRAPIDLYNEDGLNKAEYDASVEKEGENQKSVKLDFIDDYAVTNAFLLIILNGVPVPTTSA
jgi:hypothetical protein